MLQAQIDEAGAAQVTTSSMQAEKLRRRKATKTETRASRRIMELCREHGAGALARAFEAGEMTIYRWSWGLQKPKGPRRARVAQHPRYGVPQEWWYLPVDDPT